MVSLRFLAVALPFSSTVFALQVQKPGLTVPPGAAAAQAQVKQIFTNAFSAYKTFAFPHDDLSKFILPLLLEEVC
jgi:mannosyl-oligosaccharide alpha-1,2-mannosidase